MMLVLVVKTTMLICSAGLSPIYVDAYDPGTREMAPVVVACVSLPTEQQ